jgi:drug/metabolite transporter (DMT)-like permease
VGAAAIGFALGAAFLHAAWNVLLARSADPAAAGAVMILAAPVVFAPVAAVTWDVSWSAAPYVAGSIGFEVAYFVLLTTAYARAELSVVYTVARGLAPVVVLAVTALALAVRPSRLEAAGILLVGVGVVLVRGVRRTSDGRAALLGAAIAGCIAGYTIVDEHGLEHAAPLPYFELVALGTAAVFVPVAVRLRGLPAVRCRLRTGPIACGVAAFGAYVLVLEALERAEAAPVAAVRETSVVIATALAAALLREPVGLARALGAAIVTGGVALVALG